MANTSCTEFERLLEQAALDRHTADAELLRAHADLCSDCRSLLECHALLDRAIAVWRAAVPEVDLVDAVIARWAYEQESPAVAAPGSAETVSPAVPASRVAIAPVSQQKSRRVHAAVAVCAALVALIAVGLSGRLARHDGETTGIAGAPVIAVRATGSPAAGVASLTEQDAGDQEDEEIDSLLRKAGSAYLVLAQDAASAIGGTTILVKSVNESAVLPAVPVTTASPDAGRGEVSRLVEQWGRELTPMRREFGQALDFLLDDASREEPPPSI